MWVAPGPPTFRALDTPRPVVIYDEKWLGLFTSNSGAGVKQPGNINTEFFTVVEQISSGLSTETACENLLRLSVESEQWSAVGYEHKGRSFPAFRKIPGGCDIPCKHPVEWQSSVGRSYCCQSSFHGH